MPSGADLYSIAKQNPAGTTYCLAGTYVVGRTIVPERGDKFIGPAQLRGNFPLARYDGLDAYGFEGTGVNNLLFDSLEMSGFEIAIRPGPDAVVRNVYLHHNTRTGVGCGDCDRWQLLNSELAYNGSDEYLGCCASGVKTVASDVLIRGNYVHDNRGMGIWFDLDALRVVAENNAVRSNYWTGIHYEVSAGPALIRNNVVQNNNLAYKKGGHGGITATSSTNVEIYGNVMGGNGIAGLNFRDDARLYNPPFHISAHDNVMNGDEVQNCLSEWLIVCTNNR